MKTIAIITTAIITIGINAADLTTKDGKVYKDYEIISVTDKSVKIAHEDGAADIDIPDLPDDVKSSIADKAKAYKPPVARAKQPDKIIQGPTLVTPTPAKAEAAALNTEDEQRIATIKEKIKSYDEKIKDLKKELKPLADDYKLKGTFTNANRGSAMKAEQIKNKKESVELKIKNAEFWKDAWKQCLTNGRSAPHRQALRETRE